MLMDEKRFHIRKNDLDNEYSKILSHFQMTVVGLTTITIGIAIFLLQIKEPITAAIVLISASGSGAAAFFLFGKKLNSISERIHQL